MLPSLQRPTSPRALPRARGFAVWLCALACLALAAQARTTPDAPTEVALADLPKEAQEVYALIGKGGPFRYERDGVVFGNREQLLPAKPRGYYHEYTVRTPGVDEPRRPPPRLRRQEDAPDACYYTDDHYRSFRKIRP